MSLRVLMITGSYPPMQCGVGDYTAALCRALAKSGGADVAVLTSSAGTGADADREAGVKVLNTIDRWDLPSQAAVIAAVRKANPQAVHVQFPTQGYGTALGPWLMPLCLRLTGRRPVQTWHEYVPHWRSLRPLALAVPAREVLVVRPDYAKRLPWLHRLVLRSARITQLPNTVQLPASRLTQSERAALRDRLVQGSNVLAGYFGFAYPHKRIELLFEMFEPAATHLLLMCSLDRRDPYHSRILNLAGSPRWNGRVTVTGFLPPEGVADRLAACDVVALPFTDGGGQWNSSLRAAQLQGTYTVTTSLQRHGYDGNDNTFYCPPDDFAGLRHAAGSPPPGHRRSAGKPFDWTEVVDLHLQSYRRAIAGARRIASEESEHGLS